MIKKNSISAIATARSFLFVPGTRPERIVKGQASGADAVIIDLEDAVSPERKDEARKSVAHIWPTLQGRERLCIRINSAGSPDHEADAALCAQLKPAAVIVPKAESASAMRSLAARLETATALIPLIETARGWLDLHSIAQAPGIVRLSFGTLDFQADMGMQCDVDENELAPVRLALVAVSRTVGLAPPIDGVTVEINNAGRCQADALRARRFGFGGKFCIHPQQVAPVHLGFKPSLDEISWAMRVVDSVTAGGLDAAQVDGRMIDRPMLELARTLLQRNVEN